MFYLCGVTECHRRQRVNSLIPTTTLTTPDHRERKTICLLLLRPVGIVHISCSTVNVCVMGVIVAQHLRTASVGVASTYTLFLVLFCLSLSKWAFPLLSLARCRGFLCGVEWHLRTGTIGTCTMSDLFSLSHAVSVYYLL